jgi:hypothetical protein
VANPLGVWKDAGPPANGSYVQAPSADADLQFQRLRPRVGSGTFEPGTGGQILDTPVMDIVGRYDPSKLPGFSPLSKVPLGTYYPPEITPANAPSRRALGGKSLLPSANIGGYVSQPPLFLTTLKGMEAFLDPKYYEGANASAPISMIRVRVRGVNGPDTLSQARVRAVATAIHDATALQVDITAGSSPVQVRVALPAGRFGRPALLLSERWSKKGVSLQFLQALDHKRFGLLLLILASCAVFVGGVAYASVLGRRSELGILRCLGWPKRAVFTSVLAELAVVGLVAGALAALVSLAAVPRLAPGGSRWTAALAVPVSVLMALLAGLIPARNAARVAPIAVVSDPIVAPRKRRPNGGIFSMAVANARRAPVRNLAAGSGLLVASAALTVLVGIDAAFRGSVVGTLLGAAVSVKVRGLDFLAVAVVAILGAVSLLNAVLQSFRERRQETATLKAIGWGEAHILRLAAAEASLVAAICATAGGVVGGVIAMSLGVPIAALLFVIGAGVVGSIFVAVAATKVAIGIESRSGSPAISAE